MFPTAGKRPRPEIVELVTPEGVLLMEEGFGDEGDGSRNHDSPQEQPTEPRRQVLFSETWEREYHRLVKAEISRHEKGVILLEILSILYAGF